ncbi:hypothetical protein AA309_26850 [Microvirga vignae]|uniref:Uncharacterized protein n=1 Tax=Microvirga vignae TaxID=1225564 RepID=A0A0H1R4T0_9HYPH|nr:hypothetical protein [Microvirga vignae]KLK90235.1 hypothetical protein AA309_26850 [Microvirga vignae]
MKPGMEQRPDVASGPDKAQPGEGHLLQFETGRQAEWHVKDGGLFVLRLDRATGEWSGEQRGMDGAVSSNPLSPHEVSLMARAHDLRFKDGARAG